MIPSKTDLSNAFEETKHSSVEIVDPGVLASIKIERIRSATEILKVYTQCAQKPPWMSDLALMATRLLQREYLDGHTS